jgi:two-component system phosphate regulon sensor histidine kinase PhoR
VPAGLTLQVTCCIGAIPVAGLALLTAAGWADPMAALLLGLAVLAGAALLARLWAHDQALLIERLRRAADGVPGSSPGFGPSSRLARETDRLARTLADRASRIGRQLLIEEAIVETLPDPLIVLAPDRSILRANAAARAVYGSELLAVLRHPELRGAIDRTLAKGTPQTADLVLPVPVEQEVHATVFALGVPNQPDGQHGAEAGGPRIAAVLSDRTRERALERMRADFVANASHELRTPLASLIGFIDTLRGPAADDPPAQARFLQIMADQAKRMNRLIDDLLSLSRIELIEHQPPNGRVALPDLVRWVAAAFEPQVTARRQDLQVTVAAELPPVPGDEDQLAQVLHNLLENAVKYGRDGGTLRLTASVVPPGGRWPARPGVTLAVSDDGQGIAPEHLPRLTERFYRVDRGRSRAVGGTGLGLAIVKHIVNRHRGQLAIESREGEGSTFTVWLPLAASRRNGDVRDPAGTWTPAGATRPTQLPRSPRPSPR